MFKQANKKTQKKSFGNSSTSAITMGKKNLLMPLTGLISIKIQKISDRLKDIRKFFKSRPSRKLSLNSFRNGNYREYRAKWNKRKRHNFASKDGRSILKKDPESPQKTIFYCSVQCLWRIITYRPYHFEKLQLFSVF